MLTLLCSCYSTTQKMSAGEILYRRKCSSCHNLIAPSEFGEEKWHAYIKRYDKIMTPEQKQLLLEYLTASQRL